MSQLIEAAKKNDRRGMLEATRDILAYSIETCNSPRDLAALSKRLIEVCDLLDALPDPNDMNPVDEMAEFIAEYDQYEDPRLEDADD